MDFWLCHEENDQYYYFSVLPIVINNSIYRDSTRKAVDSDSSDMRTKENVDWFASWLTCIHGSTNYVMLTYIRNTCDVEREETCFSRDQKCLQYHKRRIWDTYIIIVLKGMPIITDIWDLWSYAFLLSFISSLPQFIWD
jgi:hypothetical protein